ncbi:dinuclear metal center YbgI/SA1388 family protein [Kordia periserrulae]|uniref:GTP cyclohydrolase 1 type 2 homolog n=1 Tax=Kordia periserrulae TaxID=701523 RepID=A0A2T6C5D2_9FLAO|nr:Nif3-like dinuclear metal center hexameric protein [Kordia periserrulae]PTX63492.1 dinuclear metal center YbgI/SA1388 family protein [Kordia periserrulae]
MKVQDIMSCIEEFCPLAYAEDFDNVGLLVGNSQQEVSGVLISLDTLENVVDEAIEKDCNMIVSFHPIIFSGLKKITGKTYVERVVLKAIKHDIAIYAMHTALDNSWNGVSDRMCDELGLRNKSILIPQKGTIKKLSTFVPKKDADKVRNALFAVGAGSIGNYENCSFNVEGLGSFQGNEASNPTIGTKGETHFEEEIQLGITFARHLEGKVIQTLHETHPYEEVAYEITTLENTNQHIGMGMIGELEKPINEVHFMTLLKTKMKVPVVRHSALSGKMIQKVAVLGGSGSFAIDAAKRAGVDAYVTADLKYHDFYKAEGKLILADIGHYESEQYTKNLLFEHLTKKIPNFAFILSVENTNPIKYS